MLILSQLNRSVKYKVIIISKPCSVNTKRDNHIDCRNVKNIFFAKISHLTFYISTYHECQDIVHYQFWYFWFKIRYQHVRKSGKIVFSFNVHALNFYTASKFMDQKAKSRPWKLEISQNCVSFSHFFFLKMFQKDAKSE